MSEKVKVFVKFDNWGGMRDWMTEDVIRFYAKRLFNGNTKGVSYDLKKDYERFIKGEFDGITNKDIENFIKYMCKYSNRYVVL